VPGILDGKVARSLLWEIPRGAGRRFGVPRTQLIQSCGQLAPAYTRFDFAPWRVMTAGGGPGPFGNLIIIVGSKVAGSLLMPLPCCSLACDGSAVTQVTAADRRNVGLQRVLAR
jgi:hypothetical protein